MVRGGAWTGIDPSREGEDRKEIVKLKAEIADLQAACGEGEGKK